MCEGLAVDYVCFKWQSSVRMLCTTCATVCVSEHFVECVLNRCQFYTFVHVSLKRWKHLLADKDTYWAVIHFSLLPWPNCLPFLLQLGEFTFSKHSSTPISFIRRSLQGSCLILYSAVDVLVALWKYMLDSESELALHIIKAILHQHNPPAKHCFKLN